VVHEEPSHRSGRSLTPPSRARTLILAGARRREARDGPPSPSGRTGVIQVRRRGEDC
jgi:hypothetical protein